MYMIWFGMAFNKPNAFLSTQINTSFLRLPQKQGPSRRRYISSDRQSLL